MDNFQKAKAKMLLNHVFFATILMSTEMEEKPDEWFLARGSPPTACTDMRKIYYSAGFINGLDRDTAVFVLAHEVCHIILKHGLRRQWRDPGGWNRACDYAINYSLKACGFQCWTECLYAPEYAGMSAEQIYEKRSDKVKGKDGIGNDLMDPVDLSPAERVQLEREIQQKVAQAANMARMAGKMPREIERLVDGVLNPIVPWQDLLREYMTRVTLDDESWARRNRRFTSILPARWSQRMGEIVMIGDTSGSIGDEVFTQIAAEVTYIAEQVKPELIRMIWADDSDCSREETFEPGELIQLHPKGGGGTDMRKPLKYVERFDPVCVVLITDGYTPWPESEPPYPLIVCCTTGEKVPIGQVVRI